MTLERWARDRTVALATELPLPVELDAAGEDAVGEVVVVVVVGPGEQADSAIAAVVERLRSDAQLDAAAGLEAVIDAVKVVSPDGQIVETVDRSALAHAARPIAVRAQAVRTGAIGVLGLV